jgi:DNA-binding NarL/FixJ family response regulator
VRVVAVDDDPLFLRLLQKAVELTDPDAVVLTAHGFSQARGILSHLRALGTLPDLIIIDSSLGDGCGLDLLDHLRAEPALARVPAVLMTASLDSEMFRAAVERAAIGCHQKPAGFDPLVDLVRNLIALAEQAAPAQPKIP